MNRVLVANRGEIASRIIRTLNRLGIESVAVYADVDRAAPHVDAATEAVRLDGPSPAAAYRDAEQLVTIARRTGADGIHPGYGFLSEDAAFASIVARAGIEFIGPTPDQIAWFGQKDRARTAAEAAGIPLLPGSDPLDDPASAMAAARIIGLPLMIKSVSGGGGIGMIACTDPDHLVDAIDDSMRLSAQVYGTPRVLLERLVPHARHVEVQVFGDGDGRVLVLGARDCSLQRRRQKVLEESPAPNLDPELRAVLFDSARRLLEPMRYRSAGTVEFLVDVDRNEAAFLEVNTRLQVEHPVTEAVFGIDLVEWMVRLAAGERAFLPAHDPVPSGHAIEVRLYAEDPAKGYLPNAGTLTHVALPEWTRVDTWVRSGTEVSPHFDPLLAKLVVHAPTRAEAIGALRVALDETHLDGIETNREVLRALVATDAVADGTVLTSTLDEFAFRPNTVDVIAPGAGTTIHDLPGRLGYWEVGVPPSGPFDDRSFAVGNAILGNPSGAPGLECVVAGPTLHFNTRAWVCLGGAGAAATLDGDPVPWWSPIEVEPGACLAVGAIDGLGLRTYVLVRGGLQVPKYLGSASTFTLGEFGGHGGRALRAGDVLHLGHTASDPPPATPMDPGAVPTLAHDWDITVLDGPHAAPEFFTERDIDVLYATEWEVHYHSSRTGVRLIGPKPGWARTDGGSAGLHPSNIHDTPYVPGTIDFTGDMPIILGPDGPSLGGFVCPVTIVHDELWKVGQLAPGDRVRFIRRGARDGGIVASTPANDDRPEVTYRRSGDRAVLVEFGPMTLDFDLRFRAHALANALADARLPGIIDVTPGIRSLQVRIDGERQTSDSMLGALRELETTLPATHQLEIPSRIVNLPLSWDDPATRDAIERYVRSVRDDAPWCPWNIEFIRRINGLASVDDVQRIVYDADYLVLGLGDVYLGAPVAVPIDPRHRLVTTKYNPARTWTPENAVGIGGAYLCIYGMAGPGGYQFVGRTVPVWSRYGEGRHFDPETPWLLRHFDRIRWFPVVADELLDLRSDARAGRLELDIAQSTFSVAEHRRFISEHTESIAAFQATRNAAYAEERAAWQRNGEFAIDRSAGLAVPSPDSHGDGDGNGHAQLGELPTGASVLTAPLAGAVARVHRKARDEVQAGEPVITIEAMKMEHQVAAPASGIVDRIVCNQGELVHTGAPLAVLVSRD